MVDATLFTHPVEVHYGDIWQLGRHRLICGDSTNIQNLERLLQGEQYDLCFADPPYGIGIDQRDVVLEDIPGFISIIIDHLRPNGFFGLTCQMPFMVEWLQTLQGSKLQYKDHVAWIKRQASTPGAALMRSHESLFVYSLGRSQYYTTQGKYTDVKLPGVLLYVVSLDGVKVYINDLHAKLNGDPHRMRRTPDQSKYKANGGYKGYQGVPLASDRSPEYCNFTNVWSFLPENQRKKRQEENKHVTQKPVLLMQRLIELCTSENAIIYDPFLGSGTTLIAAEFLGNSRCVYGCEILPNYCETIIHRWQETTSQQAQKFES